MSLFIFYCLISLLCLSLLINAQLPEIKPDRFIEHRELNKQRELNLNGTEFDYIVVGAGSAGCVLAHRLSQNPNIKVLLLESGPPDNNTAIASPVLFSQLFRSPLDWNYDSQPEPTLNGRSVYLPRGRVIGGSSSLNAMIVNRGDDRIYNFYDFFLDLDGWRWNDVLPYFKKSQNYLSPDINLTFQSNQGKWKQRSPPFRFNVTKHIIDYLQQQGHLGNDPSHQDGVNDGFNFHTVNLDEAARRHSLADAFLDAETLRRPNLYVRPFSQATKILFENGEDERNMFRFVPIIKKCDPEAKGVQFVDIVTKVTYTVFAKHEVVVSAGAINTPQLLMLSGIGHRRHLRGKGIKVVHHSPRVGTNLQDHPLVGMTYNITSSNFETLESALNEANFGQWLFQGTGPFGSNVNEGISYEKTSRFKKYLGGLADVKLAIAPGVYIKDGFVTFPPPTKGFSFGIELVNAQSKGWVQLNTSDPFDAPLIRTNFYKKKLDLDIVVDTFEKFRNIFVNDTFFQSFIDNEIVPGPQVQTREQLIDYIKEFVSSGYHSCCTVKMGKSRRDPLDEKLRVRGVKKLRVADASVFPKIPSANTNGPVVMVAEKASDMILEDYNSCH